MKASLHRRRRGVRFVIVLAIAAAVMTGAVQQTFRPSDKAFYADREAVAFVRPGLIIDIVGAEIAGDGTIRARVKFTDPAGVPLDRVRRNCGIGRVV